MIIPRCTCGGIGLLKEMGSGNVAVECQKCGLIGPICATESTAAIAWGTVIAAADKVLIGTCSCGGKAICAFDSEMHGYTVMCTECGSKGLYANTAPEAVSAWNVMMKENAEALDIIDSGTVRLTHEGRRKLRGIFMNIKVCPFCGEKPAVIESDARLEINYHVIRCECGIGMMSKTGDKVALKDLIRKWNTRLFDRRVFPNLGTAESIYKKAVEKYGAEYQRHRLVEECAEFIVAHEHLKRGRISEDDMIEELVDIEILLLQMKEIYPDVRWEEIYARKIARLARTIKE